MKQDKVVEDTIKMIGQEETLNLVRIMNGKKNVSEVKLAEKLNITVNKVRNLLYRLQDYSLVSSIRKKDAKKGWYIYYWNLDNKKAKDLLASLKRKKLDALEKTHYLEESNTYYVCPNKCRRLTSIEVIDYDFKCPECESLMIEDTDKKKIDRLKRQIADLKKELKIKE